MSLDTPSRAYAALHVYRADNRVVRYEHNFGIIVTPVGVLDYLSDVQALAPVFAGRPLREAIPLAQGAHVRCPSHMDQSLIWSTLDILAAADQAKSLMDKECPANTLLWAGWPSLQKVTPNWPGWRNRLGSIWRVWTTSAQWEASYHLYRKVHGEHVEVPVLERAPLARLYRDIEADAALDVLARMG